MTQLTLPGDAVRGCLSSNPIQQNLRLETDGNCLILPRVLVKGVYYDLFIHRFDHKNKLIKIDGTSQFSIIALRKIQQIVQLFLEKTTQKFTKNTYYYRKAPMCFKIDSGDGKGPKDLTRFSSNDSRNEEIQHTKNVMNFLHEKLFLEERTTYEHSLIKPTFLAGNDSETSPSKAFSSSNPASSMSSLPSTLSGQRKVAHPASKGQSKGNPQVVAHNSSQRGRKKASEHAPSNGSLPKHVQENLPLEKRLGNGAKSDQSTQTQLEGVKKYLYDQVTSNLDQVQSDKAWLKGITYRDLAEYSIDQSKGSLNPSVVDAFNHFVKVLKNTDAIRADKDLEMYDWIKKLYFQAYHNYKKLEEVYGFEDEATKKRFPEFDSWARHYAAKSIAGFIATNERIGRLVENLKKLSIPKQS